MLIEKTTLIAFDDVAERARILEVFSGQRQQHLLTALDLMIAGDFVALARAVVRTMPEDILQFMAIPMQDLISDVVTQKVAELKYVEGEATRCSTKDRELMAMRGIPMVPEARMYPRFTDITPVPTVNSETAQLEQLLGAVRKDRRTAVLLQDQVHPGAQGVLAEKLKERVRRPVFVMAADTAGLFNGSGRSIPGLHLQDALTRVAERNSLILTKFEGHSMAAGVTVAPGRLEDFSNLFELVACEMLGPVTDKRVPQ